MAVQQFPVATTFEKTRLLSEDFDELPFWYVVSLIKSKEFKLTELDLIHELNGILKKIDNRYDIEMDWLDVRKVHWEKDRIRIGVVGVTSSGKSTLINAILGNKLLTDAVRPSSSQLVSCSYSEKPKMTVFFNEGKILEFDGKELTQNLVRKFSDEKYNVDNKRIVQQVEISTPGFTLGEDVLLIDSPGLDAYNTYRATYLFGS